MSFLRISLFGDMRVFQDTWGDEIKLTRTVQNILAYLLLQRHRMQPREILLDIFWKDVSEKKARGRLNTALWRLRCALESHDISEDTFLLTTTVGEVGINPDCKYWLDIADFEEQVKHIVSLPPKRIQRDDALALERVLGLYQGDLLDGNYEDWALREREHLRQIYLNGLAYLMEYYQVYMAYPQALSFGEKILQLDPLREEIHRAMMRLYCANGQRAMAVQQYENCRAILRDELDIPPMEETQALYLNISRNHPEHLSVQTDTCRELRTALNYLKQATLSMQSSREQLTQAIELVEDLTKKHT